MSQILQGIELLAPAGSPEALDAAMGEGADAVYLGLKDFNARLRSANFTYSQFESALRAIHRMGKKVYVTVNTVFEQREADRMYQFLKYLASVQPDAIIVQDFGVIAMARSEFPTLRLHASTQMNIASARGANALSKYGVSRVVLARELSHNELQSIKNETNLELEIFVHGALCVSISGLCLFSSYLGGKSANRGMCTQACRRLYHCGDDAGESSSSDGSGYYFSPNDLQLFEHIPDLANIGINALKIEGRMKSASYAGTVVSAYRLVLDALSSGNEDEILQSIEQGNEILRNDFARPKTRYFFNGSLSEDWLDPEQEGGTGIPLGTIKKVKMMDSVKSGEKAALICPPYGAVPSLRDTVRIHLKGDSGRISHKLTFVEPVSEKQAARNSPNTDNYWISIPQGETGDNVYLIQIKEKSKRYAPVITNNAGARGPGRDKAPVPNIQLLNKKQPAVKAGNKQNKRSEIFPEGLYVAVSRPEDLYILQSSRPQKAILPLSGKTADCLLAHNSGKSNNSTPLPFKPADIILSLEPWFPQNIANYESGKLAGKIEQLIDIGYLQYIVNNPGHFSLFKNHDKINLIAGPWLYIFNSWSLSFVSSLGADYFISPLENNRQNLERTISENSNKLKSKFFITVFSWPTLFNIRADIKSTLKIKSFSDNNDEFTLVSENDEQRGNKDAGLAQGCRVYPKQYYSIIDKIQFLKEAGFGRFIIDFRSMSLKKNIYRDIIQSINENVPLPNSNRFNWKNGFYSSTNPSKN